jgi:arylsulfatase A-like enzyme
VDAEQLGRGTHTDVLAISFSTPDHLGHLMGPRAQELMDVYLRLDLQLGQLFDALDARLGRGNYYVSLTADHGSCDNSNQAALDGFAVKSWSGKDIQAQFGALISGLQLEEPGVLHVGNDQVHLKSSDDDDWALVRDALMKHPAVQMAWTADEVRASCDPKVAMRRNSFDARSGQVFYELKSGHMDYSTDGCTHGSGHAYDTHVPIVFMGPGIPANANRWERVHPRDMAPTWSMLLGTALPSSATGDPLPLGK